MFAFKWLPPGRGLSKMGTDIMFRIGGACLNNCGFASTKNIGNPDIQNAFSTPFCWLMDMSMLGVGVGFDTKGAGTVQFIKPTTVEKHIVADSREGWVQYLQQLLESFVDPEVAYPVADYSKVREKGAPIKGFGGTASGPEALELLTSRINKLMEIYVGRVVDSRAIVDIANSVGECVVAGGVRRTAEIAFGDPKDDTFLSLKDFGNNRDTDVWPRWASNNSCIVSSKTEFTKMAELTQLYGNPGYLFIDNCRKYGRMSDPPDFKDMKAEGANPCVEQTLWDLELCTLVETFPSMCDDYEDYQRTVKFAYLYAKTVTLVPTHNAATNQVMLSNRRIGCSQTGIQDNIEKIGLRAHLDWCDQGYAYIRELDQIYSGWLCIPPSIKHTSVKPSGTVSKLVGVREGIHESKGEYELQTIRIHDNSPLLPRLRAANYRVEKAIKEPNTQVVYFPMKYDRKRARNPTMWEQLELAAQMQAHWANNQVSVTIDFDRESEGPEIARALEMYAHRIKGLSFLPTENHFQQAPKTVVTQAVYEEYKATLLPLDLSDLRTHEVDDKFCDGGTCEVREYAASDAE
jgi:adenosylcobalamin-dependent ribonucleoside-triphosphate reductase